MRLADKSAFVTGAGKGIGQAIAKCFAGEGASVALFDRDTGALAETQRQIDAEGGRCQSFAGDVMSSESIRQAMGGAAQAFGGIDILVANAGAAIPGSVVDLAEEDWHRVLDINLGGVYRVAKFGIPWLLERGGGAFIATSSTQALRGFPGWAGYAATKGGILALSRQIAIEYGGSKIRSNAIAPGAIDTPMNAWVFDQAEDPAAERARWDEQNLLGRIGRAEDVAKAALYLASEDGEWVTGTCLVVDGGQLAGE